MHSVSRKGALEVLFLAIFFFVGILSPASQVDASTSVAMRQLLPPQAQTCPSLSVSDVRPYIYNDTVHSFDISISDDSYVAIDGQIGDTPISFAQMTRWRNADGSLRIHVDTQTMPLQQALPIRIILLSAHVGAQQATCVAVISSTIPSRGISQLPPASTQGNQEHETHASKSAEGASPVTVSNIATATHSLGNTCTTNGGAFRLWIVLLVLYAAFIATIAVQKDNRTYFSEEWNIVLVLGVFVALLLFWYLSVSCRTGSWAPVLATLAACIGLIIANSADSKKQKDIPLLKNPNPEQMSLLKTKSDVVKSDVKSVMRVDLKTDTKTDNMKSDVKIDTKSDAEKNAMPPRNENDLNSPNPRERS